MILESVLVYKHFFCERKGHDQGENMNPLLPCVKINKQNVHRSFNVKLALSIVQGKRPELKFEKGCGKELGLNSSDRIGRTTTRE